MWKETLAFKNTCSKNRRMGTCQKLYNALPIHFYFVVDPCWHGQCRLTTSSSVNYIKMSRKTGRQYSQYSNWDFLFILYSRNKISSNTPSKVLKTNMPSSISPLPLLLPQDPAPKANSAKCPHLRPRRRNS